MDRYSQRHMDGFMQATSDIDELLQLWRQEEQMGEARSYVESNSSMPNRTISFRCFPMSPPLATLYDKCCRYLNHENLEIATQLLPLCSHCGDHLATDQPLCSNASNEFYLCNACYLVQVVEVPAEEPPTATALELLNNLMMRWQIEEVRGEQTILEFPQGPMPIRCFKISGELALLYAQCSQLGVPKLPQCLACNAAQFTKGIPVHSGFNTGKQLCLCNGCYCKMVGEEPDEYTTEGSYNDLSVQLRQPSTNLIRVQDDLIAPLSQNPYDYDEPMLELHGILRDFFDRGNTVIIEPKEGIFSICKTLKHVFGCDWSGFSYTTGNHYCFLKCAEKYFNPAIATKYKKTEYSKCHRITCPTSEAAWVDGYLFEYEEDYHTPEQAADDGEKIVFDQDTTKGTTTGVSVAVHVGENGGKLIWLGNRNEREEFVKDLTARAKFEKHCGGGSGETKRNDVTSDEIEQILGLGKVFGWTVDHRRTTTLHRSDTGIKNEVLNQLVGSSNPPKVTKICQSFGEGFTRNEVNVSIIMLSPPIMLIKNDIVTMSQIASLFGDPGTKQTNQTNTTTSTQAGPKRKCKICRINTPRNSFSGNQWRKGAGMSKCKKCT